MSTGQLVMYEEEYKKISTCLNRLLMDSESKVIFLVDKNGQLVAGAGEIDKYDTTSLASLTAGSIAATGGLAKLIGEKEFAVLFHEGVKDNLHISIVGGKVILVVMFDSRTSLGLVRLRVRRASEDLEVIFAELIRKSDERLKSGNGGGQFLEEICDDDIDNLFE